MMETEEIKLNEGASLREEVETARDFFLKGRRFWLKIIGRRKKAELRIGMAVVSLIILDNILWMAGAHGWAKILFAVPWAMLVCWGMTIWIALRKREMGYKKAAAYLNQVWPPKVGQWTWTDMPGVLKVAQL